jgi:glycosyltransferase involved in cell wall biosynthesis
MKVVIVMPLAEQRGGGELMLTHLMQQGLGRGIDWQVVFLEEGPMVAQYEQMGIAVHVIPAGRLRTPHKMLACVQRLSALLRRERADAVLSWMTKGQLYSGPAARMAKVPALWYQLAVSQRNSGIDRLATLLPAVGVLTLSQAGSRAQVDLWPHRPVRLVHPGVELERFDPTRLPSPMAARQKLGLPTDGPLIGIVGRMQRWKGMHTLVQALPAILKVYPQSHAVLVGGKHDLEPDYPDFLAQQVRDLGLVERVIMAGLQRNIPEWMQALDVVVHASDREPFGIVIIEAMALGKPVIAGAEGGPVEIITPGVDGLLTPFEDAQALAEAVLQYLDDQQYACRLSKAARRRAAEFSTRRYADNLIAAVVDLIGSANHV